MKRCTVHSAKTRGSANNSEVHWNTSQKNRDEPIILGKRSEQRRCRMAQSCLKCLKYTMCLANFLCFVCGVAVLGLGVYLMVHLSPLTPSLTKFKFAHLLLISGIVITCVSFLGFLGALKENRCLLLTFFLLLFLIMLVELTGACLLLLNDEKIGNLLKDDLQKSLEEAKMGNSTDTMSEWDLLQTSLECCGVNNVSDWGTSVPTSCCKDHCDISKPPYWPNACLSKMTTFFEENFLTTGISVIMLCVIEVLGMCFALTLFCHISRSGLGYKL